MKNRFYLKQLSILTLFITSSSLVSCSSSPARLSANQSVPGAEGTYRTARTDNGNTKIDLSVKHLAPPEKINADANTFVVWASSAKGETPRNLGAMKVDNNLRGTLQTTTPMQTFHLFVTAEPSPTTIAPSSPELLWADVVSTS